MCVTPKTYVSERLVRSIITVKRVPINHPPQQKG